MDSTSAKLDKPQEITGEEVIISAALLNAETELYVEAGLSSDSGVEDLGENVRRRHQVLRSKSRGWVMAACVMDTTSPLFLWAGTILFHSFSQASNPKHEYDKAATSLTIIMVQINMLQMITGLTMLLRLLNKIWKALALTNGLYAYQVSSVLQIVLMILIVIAASLKATRASNDSQNNNECICVIIHAAGFIGLRFLVYIVVGIARKNIVTVAI